MGEKRNKCPICETDTALSSLFNKSMVKCENCGLIYNIFTQHPQREDEYWETYHSDRIEKSRRSLFAAILKRLENFGIQKGSILDVGCGEGEFISIAKCNGWRAEGVEISPNLCKIIAEKTGCIIHCGHLEEKDLVSESYDVITFIDVLRHAKDPLNTLRSAKRLLKLGGVVVVRDFNTSIKIVRKRFEKADPSDFQGFSKRNIVMALKKAGFSQIIVEPSPVSYETGFSKRLPSNTEKIAKQIGCLVAQFIYLLTFNSFLGLLPEMVVLGTSKDD